MIDRLPPERWHELEEIFRKEFNSYLPDPTTAEILAEMDETTGEIKSFIVLEMMLRVGQIWSQSKNIFAPRSLLKMVERMIPPGNQVIAISSDGEYDSFCEKFHMHKMPGTLYRRDT